MTIIAAIEYNDGVVIGCDSFLGNGDSKDIFDGPKFFSVGPFFIGFAGSPVVSVILRSMKISKQKRGESDDVYIYRSIGLHLRSKLIELSMEPDEIYLIVIFNGKIYEINEAISVLRSGRGYLAIGAPFASAAASIATMKKLCSLGLLSIDPEEMVRIAIEEAIELNPELCGPVHIKNIRNKTIKHKTRV